MILVKIKRRVQRILNDALKNDIKNTQLLSGKIMASLNEKKTIQNLQEVEFKVFSQWGDDGIIQYLISQLDITDSGKIFVEFGVENYTESNTRFLLINDNWKGLVIDGSRKNVDYIKGDDIYWQHDLTAICQFITKDNINGLIKSAHIEGEIGILSVDIDGNDYWLWKSINVIDPVIVISEYNSIWGYDKPYSVIYNDAFVRNSMHYSNLFYGTSLLSICDLAEEKGYDFIGCNSAGNNAYFIRKDKNKSFRKLTCKEGFVDAKFRESRDKNGRMTFLNGQAKYNEIRGLTVFNTRTQKEEIL